MVVTYIPVLHAKDSKPNSNLREQFVYRYFLHVNTITDQYMLDVCQSSIVSIISPHRESTLYLLTLKQQTFTPSSLACSKNL